MEVSSSPCKLLLLHVVLLALVPLLGARPLGHGRRPQVAPLMLPSDGVVVGGVGRSGGYIPPSPRSPRGPITLAADDGLLRRPSPRPPSPGHPGVPIPLAAADDGLLRRPSSPPSSPWHPGVPTHTQLDDDGGLVSGRQWSAPPPPDPNTPGQPLSDGVSRGGQRHAPPTPAGNPPHKPKVAVAPPIPCAAFLRVIRDAVQYMIGGLGA